MPMYAEVDVNNTVTKVFENTGQYYVPAKGSRLLQTERYTQEDIEKAKQDNKLIKFEAHPGKTGRPPEFAFLGAGLNTEEEDAE